MRLRVRVKQLENVVRLHEEELSRCRGEAIRTNTEIVQLRCQINTGHTLVFKGAQQLGWLGPVYVFECTECGARVRRLAVYLTDEQRAGLTALGYDVPVQKKGKSK